MSDPTWRCVECGIEYVSRTAGGKCGSNQPHCRGVLEAIVAPGAQDVVDALRLVLANSSDPDVELIRLLVAQAPDSDPVRGAGLLLDLIQEGSAKVEVAG